MHLKTLQFVLFFLFTVVESFSQNSGFGIKAGLSSTSMDFENEQIVPNDAQIGYQEGFFSRFGGEIFVQPELLFTKLGEGLPLTLPDKVREKSLRQVLTDLIFLCWLDSGYLMWYV